MKVFIGADHRGFELKTKLIAWLKSNNYETEDCGAFEYDQTDDYPDFAKVVARKVVNEKGSSGIVICGSGAGMDIASNKIKGIRCSLGINENQVRAARRDDDLNMLALASDYISNFQDAQLLAKAFLETGFDASEKHQRRIEKIKNLE